MITRTLSNLVVFGLLVSSKAYAQPADGGNSNIFSQEKI